MFWKASKSSICLIRKSELSKVYLASRSVKDQRTALNFLKTLTAKRSKMSFTDLIATKVWSRSSFILPSFVGKYFLVHSGRSFYKLYIENFMVGHRFGEFVLTRKSKYLKQI